MRRNCIAIVLVSTSAGGKMTEEALFENVTKIAVIQELKINIWTKFQEPDVFKGNRPKKSIILTDFIMFSFFF